MTETGGNWSCQNCHYLASVVMFAENMREKKKEGFEKHNEEQVKKIRDGYGP